MLAVTRLRRGIGWLTDSEVQNVRVFSGRLAGRAHGRSGSTSSSPMEESLLVECGVFQSSNSLNILRLVRLSRRRLEHCHTVIQCST
ncbi:hypothetical protein BDR04DRAFT_725871 [Suillus decipiens]|nr:hypothetical protein BDR04DRAFT_725871 [Suillus decipiens]